MKKVISSIILVLLVLVACRKDETLSNISSKGKKYVVKLRVNAFQQEVLGLAKGRAARISAAPDAEESPIAQATNTLLYLIYDSNGKLVLRKLQSKYEPLDNPDYGIFTDSLVSGTYTAVVIGSNTYYPDQELLVDSSSFNNAVLKIDTIPYWDNLTPDTYFKKVQLLVQDDSAEQEIKLDRIVGKLELDLADTANLIGNDQQLKYGLSLKIDSESDSFILASETAATPNVSITYFPGDFQMYILNTNTPFTVTITSLDELYNVRAEKVIKNVRCYKNKVTRLKGRLFNPDNPNANFTISVDDNWAADSSKVHF